MRPDYSILDEHELVSCAKNEPAAFAILYDQSYDKVLHYLLRRCQHLALAQDLTSETFYKALKHLAKFEPRPGKPFVAWLYRIAGNELKMYYRSAQRYQWTMLEDYPELQQYARPQLDQVIDQATEVAQMQTMLATLPNDEQALLRLRFYDEKTIPEIAQSLSSKEGTIKARLSRLLKKLRLGLQRNEERDII